MKKILLLLAVIACGAVAFGPEAVKPVQGAAPTFNKEVVRIFQQNCQTCHHPGYIAPFSLTTYAESAPFAPAIKDAVAAKRMPPWKAAPNCGDFFDARILSEQDIDAISKWADAGAPEGDPADLPAPIQFEKDWLLGKPDQELKAAETFRVPASGDDIYRCFVLPQVFEQDMYVTAVEVLPGNPKVVHHVLLYLDNKAIALGLDAGEEGPGYTCFGGPGFTPVGGLGGWAPGNFARFAPKGIGIKVPKGSRAVMQVHYHPNGEEQIDQTRVGLHFAKEPIESNLQNFPVVNLGLYIPAGKSKHKSTARMIVPQGFNIKVIGVTPHMHLLGKSIKLEATLPNGKKLCMINVPGWDFKWQGSYTYKEPISLPGGTSLKLTAVYDNSIDNPNQPNSPPKKVTWGEQTTDEMLLAFVNFIIDKKSSAAARTAVGSNPFEIESTPIMMGGTDLSKLSQMRIASSLFGTSPGEMYNWAQGYSRETLNILPWHKADPEMPISGTKATCH